VPKHVVICVYIVVKYIDAVVSIVHLTIFCYVGGEKDAISEDDSLVLILDTGEILWCGMDWIDLAQDRDLWWALVNMLMNLWVP
jgi:hypothetical protein